jgi:hypothetical protein
MDEFAAQVVDCIAMYRTHEELCHEMEAHPVAQLISCPDMPSQATLDLWKDVCVLDDVALREKYCGRDELSEISRQQAQSKLDSLAERLGTSSIKPSDCDKWRDGGTVIKWYFDEIHDQHAFAAAFREIIAPNEPQLELAQVYRMSFQKDGVLTCGATWTKPETLMAVEALRRKGFRASLVPHADELREQYLRHALKWCITTSQINDGMCHLINSGFNVPRLQAIVENSSFIPKHLVILLHDTLVALMANPDFKGVVAEAYIHAFEPCLDLFSDGIGLQEANVFSFSVQFLNRPVVVHTLAQRHALFDHLLNGLAMVIDKALAPMEPGVSVCRSVHRQLALNDPVMRYRRYIPVIGDMKVRQCCLIQTRMLIFMH